MSAGGSLTTSPTNYTELAAESTFPEYVSISTTAQTKGWTDSIPGAFTYMHAKYHTGTKSTLTRTH
jgi:hypothetical protein